MNSKTNITEVHNQQQVAESIAENISNQLNDGRNVIWFMSGGSSIPLSVAIRELLKIPKSALLHICLIDERYGNIGHQNSNWQALIDAGFNFENCTKHPILQNNVDVEQLAKDYSETIRNILNESQYVVGVFGLGKDGHTAGLLPFNPLMDGNDLYGSYRARDYVRISATPLLIPALDEAVLYVWGGEKRQALSDMLTEGSIDKIPGRILNGAKKLDIYTNINIKGEKK